MTDISSVTNVGTISQGVNVKTSITEVAAAKISMNFSRGVFVCVVCCISPQYNLQFTKYNQQVIFFC
jgi:hypothetical protein